MTIGLGRRHPRLRHDVEVGRNGSPTSHAGESKMKLDSHQFTLTILNFTWLCV